jgi:hypothetical protein
MMSPGAARWPREKPSSSGAASEKAAELQQPKKKCKRGQQRKALGFSVEHLAKFGLKVDSRDGSSSSDASVCSAARIN